MTIKRPPEHAVDATPLLVLPRDDAWDMDRVRREEAELVKGEVHPVRHFLGGGTRYDLDGGATLGGTFVTARQYLRTEVTPTVFHLRRVGGKRWRSALPMLFGGRTLETAHSRRLRSDELWDLTRAGLAKVTDGFGDDDDARWPLDGGDAGQPLTEQDMERLFNLGGATVEEIGWAVFNASRPLTGAEGKH